jgi:hypothetical protein
MRECQLSLFRDSRIFIEGFRIYSFNWRTILKDAQSRSTVVFRRLSQTIWRRIERQKSNSLLLQSKFGILESNIHPDAFDLLFLSSKRANSAMRQFRPPSRSLVSSSPKMTHAARQQASRTRLVPNLLHPSWWRQSQ